MSRLTARVTRLGWEGGFTLETEFRASQKHAQKRGAYPKSGARYVGWLHGTQDSFLIIIDFIFPPEVATNANDS